MALFGDFNSGNLLLYSLNFGTIILLPKLSEAIKIQQYRPICLLTVSFKIFTKMATNRLLSVAGKVISPTQTTFLPGRNIMEGVVVIHETLHELHRKENWVTFKIDFEKAYDKTRWSFVRQTLEMKGFSEKWCNWIEAFTQGGHVNIKINDQLGDNFQTRKGLRQGDPLSPILFNIGASEQLSSLKINYHKSEIICFGEAKNSEQEYSHLFGCQMGGYPFKYLGIPMHYKKLRNSDWNTLLERIEKKLSSWKGKHLSAGGRLVLINSVLTSLSLYMLSFFEVPMMVLEKT